MTTSNVYLLTFGENFNLKEDRKRIRKNLLNEFMPDTEFE